MPKLILALKLAAGALTLLLAILLINTWRLPALPDAGGAKLEPVPNLEAAAERLAGAIRIPTISYGFANPPGGNRFPELHEFLQKNFPLTHATLQRERINTSSLLYTWQGSDPSLAPILLTAHLDVVPIEPGTESAWTHPPFAGVVADGFVWGRGTMDNKHMVIATLEGVELLLAQGFKPTRTVILAFGHDEEVGGHLGAKFIADTLEQRKVRALFSLDEGSGILDGIVPGASRPIAQIGIAEKGFMSLQLKAVGQGGHSSMPPANTAVGKLGRAIGELESHQMPASLTGPGAEGLRAMAPTLPFARRLVLANTWLFGPLLMQELAKTPNTNALIRTTTAPTMINGGVKENVLPTEATAVINFRIAPGDTVASVKAHVERVIANPDITIADYLKPGADATPVADIKSPGFTLISEVIRQVEPSAVIVPGLVVAGTDSKHWSRVSGATFRFIPVRLTSDDLKRIHATDERISIANYGEIVAFYRTLISSAAKQ